MADVQPSEPVVPLQSTVQCEERMSVHGESFEAVDVEQLKKDLADLKRQKPEAIAISLLNSYTSGNHKKDVAKVVRVDIGPDVDIVCSTDVLKEAGEHERSVMTAANSLVMPIVRSYLGKLASTLKSDSETIRILRGDGGLTSLEVAGEFPVSILMSGPAGGVKGVADAVFQHMPYGNLITLDMGGTSTDCALFHQGTPRLRRETIVDELRVRSPAIDVCDRAVSDFLSPQACGLEFAVWASD